MAFWGGVFVALSGDRIGATIAASVFMFALLVCLRYSPNKLLVGLCIGFILVTLAVTLIEWLVFKGILEYVTLFYGTFVGYVLTCKPFVWANFVVVRWGLFLLVSDTFWLLLLLDLRPFSVHLVS